MDTSDSSIASEKSAQTDKNWVTNRVPLPSKNSFDSLTEAQITTLKEWHEVCTCPDKEQIAYLAKTTNLSAKQVKNWFNHREPTFPFSKITPKFLFEDQLIELERRYKICPYPTDEETLNLGLEFGVPQNKIRRWFKYRRMESVRKGEPVPGALRERFTPEQLKVLKGIYEKNRYPKRDVKESLAKELNIPLLRIDRWFGTRRRRRGSAFTKPPLPSSRRKRTVEDLEQNESDEEKSTEDEEAEEAETLKRKMRKRAK
ncbi:hypothetical protein L596_028918 [Steinernema carpocapsae]|uniref:Homeobox domain-containing protein n=1 Tax=Steinernema carpocapsae TaxID=34508 RepID=A0A4V6XVN9_STECR|nr:hypothetical protein L596_028918 [Steinernema carpocapsae]